MIYSALADRIRKNKPVVLLTVIDGPNTGATLLVAPNQDKIETLGSLGDSELDRVASRDALGELEAGRTSVRNYGPSGQVTPEDLQDTPIVRIFVESFSPPPQMIIFGAVDFTAALARVAKVLGYYATKRRFPMADEVLVTWPTPVLADRGPNLGARDAICILTHDPKFDVPAIQGALASSVGYIGVMGSRKTHAKRLERLAEVGISKPQDLARLMSPIGLDIGSRTPEETAISICAEIIGKRVGRTVPSLANSEGPIHR
jgi:xanthine dehydrogenase accessory factor